MEHTPGNVYQWIAHAARESAARQGNTVEAKVKKLKLRHFGHRRSVPLLGVQAPMVDAGDDEALIGEHHGLEREEGVEDIHLRNI